MNYMLLQSFYFHYSDGTELADDGRSTRDATGLSPSQHCLVSSRVTRSSVAPKRVVPSTRSTCREKNGMYMYVGIHKLSRHKQGFTFLEQFCSDGLCKVHTKSVLGIFAARAMMNMHILDNGPGYSSIYMYSTHQTQGIKQMHFTHGANPFHTWSKCI